jgi:membrane protein implicated in regulation of membrane protease activity
MNPGITILIVVVAVFAGIFLAGLYGDVVVGAVIFGIVVTLQATARLVARALGKVRRVPRRRTERLRGRRAASVGGRLT